MDSTPTESSGKGDFNGVFVRNENRIKPRKSIVICGITRGGTSFAASVFGNLGVPFTRPGEPEIGRRYEHRALRAAFQARDSAAIQAIAEDFSAQHAVWAWKLPSIQHDFDFVAKYVPNPHFVIIFKEPLSIACRKTDLKGRETIHWFSQVLAVYQRLLKFAGNTEHPLLLMSYDRGMSKLEKFLPEVAAFAGIPEVDVSRAIEGIREDGKRYFRSGEEEGNGEGEGAGAGEGELRLETLEEMKEKRKARKAEKKAEKKVIKARPEKAASFL